MMTSRISWIDSLRGLGIIFVVIIHSTGSDYVRALLMSFTIPMLFFISGFVLNAYRFTAAPFILSRLRSRIVPYVIWFLIFYLIATAGKTTGQDYGLSLTRLVHIDAVAGFLSGDFDWLRHTIHNGPLWFLPCLFLVETCFYPFRKASTIPLFTGLLVTSCGALFLYSSNDWRVPYIVNLGTIMVLYYGSGFLVRRYWAATGLAEFAQKRPVGGILLSMLLIALMGCALSVKAPSEGAFTLPLFLSRTFLAFCGILSFSMLSISIQEWRWLRWLGRNTLIIFILYEPLRQTSLMIFKSTSFTFFNNIFVEYRELFTVLQIATVLILSLPLIFIIDSLFPFLSGKQYKKKDPLGSTSRP